MEQIKGRDLLVLFKLCGAEKGWTFRQLASDLAISVSQVHESLARAESGRLYVPSTRTVNRDALWKSVLAIPHLFPPALLGQKTGMATAHSASPLRQALSKGGLDFVWPVRGGKQKGEGLEPIAKTAPQACRKDEMLHEILSLVDALRVGKARERELAERFLKERLVV